MNFSKLNLLFAVVILFIASSCDELFQLTNKCTLYTSKVTTATTAYELDHSVENCQKLEAAVKLCVDSCSAIDDATMSFYEGMLDTLDCSDVDIEY